MLLWLFVLLSIIVTNEIHMKQKRNLSDFMEISNQVLILIVLCQVILCHFNYEWLYECIVFNIIYILLSTFVLLTV